MHVSLGLALGSVVLMQGAPAEAAPSAELLAVHAATDATTSGNFSFTPAGAGTYVLSIETNATSGLSVTIGGNAKSPDSTEVPAVGHLSNVYLLDGSSGDVAWSSGGSIAVLRAAVWLLPTGYTIAQHLRGAQTAFNATAVSLSPTVGADNILLLHGRRMNQITDFAGLAIDHQTGSGTSAHVAGHSLTAGSPSVVFGTSVSVSNKSGATIVMARA